MMLDAAPVGQAAIVAAPGGILSARALAQALTSRGYPAYASSFDALIAAAPDDGAPPDLVLVDADLNGGDVEQTCSAIRTSLPDAKLLLLVSAEGEAAQLSARRDADLIVSRADGLAGVLAGIESVKRGKSRLLARRRLPRQRAEGHAVVTALTPREREVLRLMATGAPNSTIAVHLEISPHTVRTHVQNVLAKLGAENRLAAAAMARRAGILPTGPDSAHLLAVSPR